MCRWKISYFRVDMQQATVMVRIIITAITVITLANWVVIFSAFIIMSLPPRSTLSKSCNKIFLFLHMSFSHSLFFCPSSDTDIERPWRLCALHSWTSICSSWWWWKGPNLKILHKLISSSRVSPLIFTHDVTNQVVSLFHCSSLKGLFSSS